MTSPRDAWLPAKNDRGRSWRFPGRARKGRRSPSREPGPGLRPPDVAAESPDPEWSQADAGAHRLPYVDDVAAAQLEAAGCAGGSTENEELALRAWPMGK